MGALVRAHDAIALLEGPAVKDAQQLVQLSTEALTSDDLSDVRSTELKRELGTLVELVARRDARSMPLAALGRASIAQLFGNRHQAQLLLQEFESKLAMLGM